MEFPEDFSDSSLAGRKAHYTFNVSEVHGMQKPELTDDLAKTVGAESIEDIPPEAARDRESLRHYGVKGTLVLPLRVRGGPTTGILTLASMVTERPLPKELVARLGLVAEVVVNGLERKRSDEALRRSLTEVESGRFRQDLYFRLAVFPIRVPPCASGGGTSPCGCGPRWRSSAQRWPSPW